MHSKLNKIQPAMNTTPPPARNYLAAAMPSHLHPRDEYIASVFGSAALGLVATMAALDAIDTLRERCPQLERGLVRKGIRNIEGSRERMGQLRKLQLATRDLLGHKEDMAWLDDFGNAVNERVEPQLLRFRTAIANCLGRHRSVTDPNVCAMVIVAQSLAHEQTAYIERRAQMFTRYTMETTDGCRRNVSWVLGTLSCKGIDHSLKLMAQGLLEHSLPPGFDLLADQSVATGCKAVLNTMASVDTWVFAREKAERFNKTD